jgi:hypothetical protein
LISIKVDELSESQLAEIALAIQNRWDIPTFVKMHEIIAMDDEELYENPRVITQPIGIENFEKGLTVIIENLELGGAFSLVRSGKSDFKMKLIDPSKIPKWIDRIKPQRAPEGVYECMHCGAWFNTEVERDMHTKLHYII